MPSLFPETYEDETLTAEEIEQQAFIGYKGSLYFDTFTGDFVRSGTNQIVPSSGTDAWMHWIIKTLQTPRYACMAYSTDIGVEVEEAFQAKDRKVAESILTRTINEAIMADPYGRTKYVKKITFDWSDDTTVSVDVTVVGIEEQEATVNATITK